VDIVSAVARPLAIDLDGTLLRTDSLVEAMLRLAARAPFKLLALLPALLTAGRAAFKSRIAEAESLQPGSLIYNDDVLALARAARAAGRPVYLVTAADASVADAVAAHTNVFDGVFASDGVLNLKGRAKAHFLVEKFGAQGFDYVGDAAADVPVWREARQAYVVAPNAALLRQARAAAAGVLTLGIAPSLTERARRWAKALRVHQWAKNVLIFLPVVAGHRFDGLTLIRAAAAFAAFSLCASSVYLLNDLLDLPHDRLHPTKRHRPFASGALDLTQAPALMAVCLGGGFAIALLLPPRFMLMLAVYYVCTLTYSLGLKRRAVWDVMMLAGLYTLRVFVGSAATFIPISPWLLAFSLFLFFCLAVVKRQTELVLYAREGRTAKLSGRGYTPDDLDMLRSMAASSGYMSVLVLALYVNSPDVLRLYHHPSALWVLCPVMLFWVSRVLMLSHRGEMNDDPVIFALRDRVSLAVGAAALCAVMVGAV
jgi:4-hydroxybenzoate polyprenyltransferase/phosphoglycolate phosphatase-like HAD superfamily hydrolase